MKGTNGRGAAGILLILLGVLLAAVGVCMLVWQLSMPASMGIIGGADGPTVVFVTGRAGLLAGILQLLGGLPLVVLGAGAILAGVLLRKK